MQVLYKMQKTKKKMIRIKTKNSKKHFAKKEKENDHKTKRRIQKSSAFQHQDFNTCFKKQNKKKWRAPKNSDAQMTWKE